MPDGSSSAAPVIRPGPQFEISRRRPARLGAAGGGAGLMGAGLMGDGFVTLDFTVANVNYAMRV